MKLAADSRLEIDLEEIPEDELDGILQRFYVQMKKEQWRKLLTKVMQALLDRYSKRNAKPPAY